MPNKEIKIHEKTHEATVTIVCQGIIICPGCGWYGKRRQLKKGACPQCGYENGAEPYRLLTLAEMFEDATEHNNVRFDLFLKTLFQYLNLPSESI